MNKNISFLYITTYVVRLADSWSHRYCWELTEDILVNLWKYDWKKDFSKLSAEYQFSLIFLLGVQLMIIFQGFFSWYLIGNQYFILSCHENPNQGEICSNNTKQFYLEVSKTFIRTLSSSLGRKYINSCNGLE